MNYNSKAPKPTSCNEINHANKQFGRFVRWSYTYIQNVALENGRATFKVGNVSPDLTTVQKNWLYLCAVEPTCRFSVIQDNEARRYSVKCQGQSKSRRRRVAATRDIVVSESPSFNETSAQQSFRPELQPKYVSMYIIVTLLWTQEMEIHC